MRTVLEARTPEHSRMVSESACDSMNRDTHISSSCRSRVKGPESGGIGFEGCNSGSMADSTGADVLARGVKMCSE